MHNKKKIPKPFKIENFKGLCTHIQTIALQIDSVKSYFPEYFESDVEMSHEYHPDEENGHNSLLLDDNIEVNFDVETGLWNFPSMNKIKAQRHDGPTTHQIHKEENNHRT